MQATSQVAHQMRISSREEFYKSRLAQSIDKNGRDSLDTGLALLDLAELYDRHSEERDSEPLWRDIERILANHVRNTIAAG